MFIFDKPDPEVTTEDVAQRFSKARLWLASQLPFFGYLCFNLRLIEGGAEARGVSTAAVAPDGSLYINQEFSNTLPNAVFRFVLVHEVLHPGMEFFTRLGSKHLRLWNMAHDHAINIICEDYARAVGQDGEGFKVWAEALLNRERYEGWSGEQIYEDLLSNPPPDKGECEGECEGQSGAGKQGDARPDLNTTDIGKKAEKGCAASQTQLKHEWASKIHEALKAHTDSQGQGTLPGSLQKYVDSLLTPQVYWDEYLQNYLGVRIGREILSYSRPNRRSEAAGVILAGRRRNNSPDITVLWDTSGSQAGWEKRVLSEIQGICEDLGATARVLIIDTDIHADVMIEDAEEIINQIKGGGGSNFMPAFNRLADECDSSVVIAFTDGYITVPPTAPEQLQDVLWVITEGGKCPVSYGTTIHITQSGEVKQ